MTDNWLKGTLDGRASPEQLRQSGCGLHSVCVQVQHVCARVHTCVRVWYICGVCVWCVSVRAKSYVKVGVDFSVHMCVCVHMHVCACVHVCECVCLSACVCVCVWRILGIFGWLSMPPLPTLHHLSIPWP